MDLPKYEFSKFNNAARCTVAGLSLFEAILVLFGLHGVGGFSSLVYFVMLFASLGVSIHNIALDVDARMEIRKVLNDPALDARGRSAAMVGLPLFAALFVFLCVTHNLFFSCCVFFHLGVAGAQLGSEIFEMIQQNQGPPTPTTPQENRKFVPRADPNYQTLKGLDNKVFSQK